MYPENFVISDGRTQRSGVTRFGSAAAADMKREWEIICNYMWENSICSSFCRYQSTNGRIIFQNTAKVNKGKSKGLSTCYSAAYMSRLEQQRFTISEVAADCHELMIPWRIMRPPIARGG